MTKPHPQASPIAREPILLLGPESRFHDLLARELAGLPAEVLRADDFGNAGACVGRGRRAPSIVLLPERQIRIDSFEEELAALRIRTGAERIVPIAFGRAPGSERRADLRRAGIELALFGRFGRNTLRFQINRASGASVSQRPRGDRRAPKEWRTRTFSGGREKAVRCYSLSSGGGYFVTPRPWVVGSDIALELPLGRRRLLLAGHILYTNVAGAGEERALPSGMAIGFGPLPTQVRDAIRRDVNATHRGLEV